MKYRRLKEHWWRLESKLKHIPYALILKVFVLAVSIMILCNIQLYLVDLNTATVAQYSKFMNNELIKKHEYVQQSAIQTESAAEYENMKSIHLKLSKEMILCEAENKILKSHIEILVKQRR